MSREGIFVNGLWVEKDSSEPKKVDEIGLTSAPLKSMAFYFAKFCQDYNDDYILCKSKTNDPEQCLLEGRKVTRCGIDFAEKLKAKCLQQWQEHYECLDMNNQMYQKCRPKESLLSDCVFREFGITKTIPDADGTPIHLKQNPIYK
ncbi:hypothetical protein EDD86DRAFT_195635 [Gorgonomyces haynaldii]|nr:hypothetical protein EDD86DRAFT_195635 [Gorgonomyces haynaldii]